MEKIRNEDIGAPVRALTESELAQVAGGVYDDGAPWCGTHPPGWHPPVFGPQAA